MVIDIRSRKMIEQNQYDANIISITSNPVKANIINLGPTLFLRFEDFDRDLPGWSIQPIQKSDAKTIVNFVMANRHNGKHFIVQCDAGVSRSARVVAALMKYFNGDDSPIFDNPQYCPNMRCYKMVLEALMEGGNG